MPPGFPSDLPIYPKARLTAGASFVSSGQVSWGMEWETLDSVAKVQAFYTDKLNQGEQNANAMSSRDNDDASAQPEQGLGSLHRLGGRCGSGAHRPTSASTCSTSSSSTPR